MNVAFRALVALSTTEHPELDPWTPGTSVTLTTPFVEPVVGRVAFADAGWVYWAAEDGHVHASRTDVITRSEG